ncbi:MAG: DNA recombination protein RmuC [Acidobacteria bacterium]|nr:DNA recombination protein RmuC [Acidobacteriota bacterium]MCB9397165.1 DNA recombination protein RmuC [Acidobacteriota bacterium]
MVPSGIVLIGFFCVFGLGVIGVWVWAIRSRKELQGQLLAAMSRREIAEARATWSQKQMEDCQEQVELQSDRILDLERENATLRHALKGFESESMRWNQFSETALRQQNQWLNEQWAQIWQHQRQSSLEEHSLNQMTWDKMLQPILEGFKTMQSELAQLALERQEGRGSLEEVLRAVKEGQGQLLAETHHLKKALNNPGIRGKWGEQQLKRVLEWAGLSEGCDFIVQPTITGESEVLRPDLMIILPSRRRLIVDAKAPVQALLNENLDPAQQARHVKHLRSHIQSLGRKRYGYWAEHSPEFVILFLPNEQLLGWALAQDETLLDFAADEGVLLASPMSLFAVLKLVAQTWEHQQFQSVHHKLIGQTQALERHVRQLAEPLSSLRKHLNQAVSAFNQVANHYAENLVASTQALRKGSQQGYKTVDCIGKMPVQISESGGVSCGSGDGS